METSTSYIQQTQIQINRLHRQRIRRYQSHMRRQLLLLYRSDKDDRINIRRNRNEKY